MRTERALRRKKPILSYAICAALILSVLLGGVLPNSPLLAFQRPISAESEWLKISNCKAFNNWVGKYGGSNKKSRSQITAAKNKFCPQKTVKAKPKPKPKPAQPARSARTNSNTRSRGSRSNSASSSQISNARLNSASGPELYQFALNEERRRDGVRARGLFRRSCEAEYALACHKLGKSYWGPENNQAFYNKDQQKGTAYEENACLLSVTQNLSSKYSYCFNAAILKSFTGRITSSTPPAVRRYYEFSGRKLKIDECASWPSLCTMLGQAYLLGQGGKGDLREARRLLVPACDARVSNACNYAGLSYTNYSDRNYPLGIKYIERSCSFGNLDGCRNARIFHSLAFYKQLSPEKARFYFEKSFAKGTVISKEINKFSCKGNAAEQCRVLGLGYVKSNPRNYAYAASLFRRACEEKDYQGCGERAKLYEYGTGVRRDYNIAFGLYKTACDKGFSASCSGLARLYRNKRSGYYSPANAARYSRRASCLSSGVRKASCQR